MTGAFMRVLNLSVAILVLSVPISAFSQTSKEPVVAFAKGSSLILATASGQIAQRINLDHPVYNFALSPDRKLLASVALDTATGGNLSLIDLQTHTRSQLTNGHLYFKSKDLDKGETEVYDDPQFSPDGRSLAFAIHTDNPGDGNDAINDSGPIAVMDMQTLQVTVLRSTENIDGQGLCFANTPMWSPDGRWILFNCEAGAFITDVSGIALRDLKLGTDRDAYTYAVSWLGNTCILYLQRHTTNGSLDPSKDEVLLYNLRTAGSQNQASKMPFPDWIDTGLREASDSAFILESSAGKIIETKGRQWRLPSTRMDFNGYTPLVAPAAHILNGWHSSTIPQDCKEPAVPLARPR
jgi:Tol biopolymer transport system component